MYLGIVQGLEYPEWEGKQEVKPESVEDEVVFFDFGSRDNDVVVFVNVAQVELVEYINQEKVPQSVSNVIIHNLHRVLLRMAQMSDIRSIQKAKQERL